MFRRPAYTRRKHTVSIAKIILLKVYCQNNQSLLSNPYQGKKSNTS